ncbi:MFS transporter [Novosphingobium sp.]|uniref:MFS transporter n=1 Tax=Novosphingobium sp. TaxID=1874826 RepID=UPI003BA8A21B
MTDRSAGLRANQPLGAGAMLGYGVGSVGTGVYSTVPGILLLYFATQQLHLPPALAGAAILAPKLVVIFADPLIGRWSDREVRALGSRRRLQGLGIAASAVAFTALFAVPQLATPQLTALLLAASYLLASLAYSFFAVPYLAVSVDLALAEGPAARLIGIRLVFAFAGILLGASGAPALVTAFGGGAPAYRWMALAIAACCACAMTIAWLRPIAAGSNPAPAAAISGFALMRLRGFRAALGVYFLAMAGCGTASAATAYYLVIARARPEADIGQFFLIQIGAAILAMIPWSIMVERTGTARGMMLALGLAVIASLALSMAISWPAILAGAAFGGLATAGIQVAGFSALAAFGRSTGTAASATLAGVWSAAEKVALALGPALCGLALSFGGFRSGVSPALQTDGARFAAVAAMGVVPCGLFVLAAVCLALQSDRMTPQERARRLES